VLVAHPSGGYGDTVLRAGDDPIALVGEAANQRLDVLFELCRVRYGLI
jgi:hypothetical protein